MKPGRLAWSVVEWYDEQVLNLVIVASKKDANRLAYEWLAEYIKQHETRQTQVTWPYVVRQFSTAEDTEGDAPYRVVQVPKNRFDQCENQTQLLDLIFELGQNDFQNQSLHKHCSVSVGDVIYLSPDTTFIVQGAGFKAVTAGEIMLLEGMNRRDRTKFTYGFAYGLTGV